MSTAKVGQVELHDLEDIVGSEHAREAGPTDAVDGVPARFVVEPGSVEEAGEILRLAGRIGLAVTPRGAGTKLHWGNPPTRCDLIVSTVRLNRLLEHAAGDLVVRVEAGAVLDQVQSQVARVGQRLALNPPEAGATIGGIVAANASGPLRLRFGTARDLIIGITYVLPNGTIARAGGKVVKNVAGYDIGKLFTGSLGTLGLIVEAIFRLHPVPAATRTVIVRGIATPSDLGASVQSILHSSLVPSAIEFTWHDEGMLFVLFEGIEPGVLAQAEKAADLLRPHGQPRMLEELGERTLWESWSKSALEAPPDRVTLKIGAPPADLPFVLDQILSTAESDHFRWRVRGHAGNGIAFADLSGDAERLTQAILQIRRLIAERGGSAVVHEAPPEVKRAVDVWGPVGDTLPLMRRIKEQFDPEGIMNPGRFVGGL